MNAQGPFTAVSLTVTLAPPFPRFTPPARAVSLTVTILMDVVVVLLFAFTNLLAASLSSATTSHSASAGPLMVLVSFVAQVALSGFVGLAIGHTLPLFFGCLPARRTLHTHGSLAMLAGSALLIALRLLMLLLQAAQGWG